MAEYLCFIPVLVLAIFTAVSNLAMVIHVFKGKNSSPAARLLFKLIGISNLAYGMLVSIQSGIRSVPASKFLLWFLWSALLVFYFLHMGFNVALAFERLAVVSSPFFYCTHEAKKALEKKLCFVVSILCMILSFIFITLKFALESFLPLSISMSATRIMGYVILCVLYYKLFRAMKTENTAVYGNSTDRNDHASNRNKDMILRRRRQLLHSRKFFIGITSSFALFNLPTMVTFLIVHHQAACDTEEGIAGITSICFVMFNSIFDTLWYFHMNRRSRNI